ncbi:MAG: protein translocase subunit SecD [Ilumatobacteraceae bacterium]|nr:protein translocase subunit SecD [Ilumatobacteraceae bacterium]
MKKSGLWASVLLFIGLVVGLLGLNLAADNHPVLGLDLRGGVSVILAPEIDGTSSEDLEFVRDLVRDQLESTGIAEPDVRVEGTNVIVDLPGVRDQDDALAAVSVSGIVDLRPVLATGIAEPSADPAADGATLVGIDGRTYTVGPSGAQGDVFVRKSAGVSLDQTGNWQVTVDLTSDGNDDWNALASQCFAAQPGCQTGQLAIVLDNVVQSAPNVNQPVFDSGVSITGRFTEDEARSLAGVLNRGAFPVQMVQERVETVSPTAGQDSLDAAIIAGLLGVALTLAYMIVFYRRLAFVIVSGLVVWAGTVYLLATYVSQATNYAFTLAGATGVIVSIGITVDTYIVLFERLRDETRQGRALSNAAPRSFAMTWRTIVAANLIGLMSALILFWLSVGSVKGFALYVGLTTICDLLVCWFFIRPAILLFANSRFAGDGRAATGVTAPIGATS